MNWRLYLVTDRGLMGDQPIETVVEDAVIGGVTIVQLREKDCEQADYIEIAQKLKELLIPYHVPLIINDSVDVARTAGADGVHLGQSDTPAAEAREALGPDAIIGISVNTMADVLAAEDLPVNYIAASPVFPTPTKTDTAEPWGLSGLREIKKRTKHPVVAIGGINVSNAAQVIEAGADGVAVVSAICAAKNPEAAARHLRDIVEDPDDTAYGDDTTDESSALLRKSHRREM